jgi:hypothetical protein
MLVASDGSINANGDTYRTVGKIAPRGNKVKHQDPLLFQPTCGFAASRAKASGFPFATSK